MTTTPTASPELPDPDHLEALARAADQGEGQHIYTNRRDSNGWQANEAWHRAASPAAVLALIALARRAAQQTAAPGALEKSARALAEKWHKDAVDTGFATSEAAVELLEVVDAATSAPGTPEAPQTAAARDVLAERQRQIQVEGWKLEHDDAYSADQLPRAACAYILGAPGDPVPRSWPWSGSWWKPRDARANYVRAGALLMAEIERLDRAAQLDGGQGEGQ